METRNRKITIGVALIPVIFLVGALSVTIIIFDQPPHIPLLLSSAVAPPLQQIANITVH